MQLDPWASLHIDMHKRNLQIINDHTNQRQTCIQTYDARVPSLYLPNPSEFAATTFLTLSFALATMLSHAFTVST